jgi:hypothetical protein
MESVSGSKHYLLLHFTLKALKAQRPIFKGGSVGPMKKSSCKRILMNSDGKSIQVLKCGFGGVSRLSGRTAVMRHMTNICRRRGGEDLVLWLSVS